MFQYFEETERIKRIIRAGAESNLTDEEFIMKEIARFKVSPERMLMLTGEYYYRGYHDILKRKRQAIGEGGMLQEVPNLPNNKIVDNQYRQAVDKKNNYLLGKPISFKSDNKNYGKAVQDILGSPRFLRLMKNIGRDSINQGLGWLFPFYDECGDLSFRRFPAYSVIALWKDEDHTVLDAAIRFYEVTAYVNKRETTIEKVEVFTKAGIFKYTVDRGKLKPDDKPYMPYFVATDERGTEQCFNWSRIPLIPFRCSPEELPLIHHVKSLQDGINKILSNFENNMEEDPRNTILIIVNYDGENLGEFRRNLLTYGAVKVRSNQTEGSGDVRTLQIEVNAENYKLILELFKKALIENARSFDAKDDRMSNDPNMKNIQSMYSDIDIDTNGTETEYQASFEDLLWFVGAHLYNTGQGDFEDEQIEVIFDRDILINETEVIENLVKSEGLLSDETRVSQHPYVSDPEQEMKRLKKEEKAREDKFDLYQDSFGHRVDGEEDAEE